MVLNWINIAQEKLPWKDILPNVESMLLDDGMTGISKKSTLFVSKHENVDNRRLLVPTVTEDVTNIRVCL